MEPQWNPSLERQAIGRAVRLGQTKEVKVVKYITAVSIEEVHD
jgi:SWI/SNF-related matrix-associated actin-dependent regulator of chromatin subfamily A3